MKKETLASIWDVAISCRSFVDTICVGGMYHVECFDKAIVSMIQFVLTFMSYCLYYMK